MEIRLAQIKDIADICCLYNDFFDYNARQQPQYYQQAIEKGEYPRSVIESDSEDIYVAVEDGAIVGLIHVIEEKTPPFDCFIQHRYTTIMDLFVKEHYRNTGIGGRLLESIKQWAKLRELDYIELNVLAENENGIQFYNHEKFKAVSQIMRYTL